jgi:hypothetical protein
LERDPARWTLPPMNNEVFYGLTRRLKEGVMPNNVGEGVKLIINRILPHYSIQNNFLIHSNTQRIIIPAHKRLDTLRLAHDHPLSGHMGINNTLYRLSQKYYWPNMKQDIQDYISACEVCQKRRKDKDQVPISSAKIVPKPFYHLGIDVIGPLPVTMSGNRYVVVAIDFFTKWPEARAVPVADATTITQFLYEEIITRHGIPNQATSDHGTEFCNELIETLARNYQIKHIRTTAYHPQGNGQTERVNRTLKDILSKISLGRDLPWDQYLHSALFAIRTIQQKSTHFSPFELLYARQARDQVQENSIEVVIPVPWEQAVWDYVSKEIDRIGKIREEAAKFIQKSQDYQRKHANREVKDSKPLSIGDEVLLYRNIVEVSWSAKLEPKWEGPFFVQNIKGTSIWLRRPNGTILPQPIHRTRLKKYLPRQDAQDNPEEP